MKKLKFTKMVASGNDFVVVNSMSHELRAMSLGRLAKEFCDRKYGIGADGLLVLGKSRIADVKMRIFNADGSEAQMCGNGARCVALYNSRLQAPSSKLNIETGAGIIEAFVNGDSVKIKLTDPKGMKLNIPVKLGNRVLRVNFINTGVPHAVIFVEGLGKIDVAGIGRQVRFHKTFAPKGANVNFVELLSRDSIKVRTYERGVEDETLACGTGSAASSLLAACSLQLAACKINVHTESGEVLKVYFDRDGDKFTNVWLEGRANVVYTGVYDV